MTAERVYGLGVITALFHMLLGLLRYFLDIEPLLEVDYLLGMFLAVAVMVYLVQNRKEIRSQIRFHLPYVLFAGMTALYLLSCAVANSHFQGNWWNANTEPLYDVAVLFFVVYPLGRYTAKKGAGAFAKWVLYVFTGAWTLFMAIVLWYVFHNTVIVTPSGRQIGMGREIALHLGSNYNTTGCIEMVMFFLSLCLVFWSRPVYAKGIWGLCTLVHLFALMLSNSRTCYVSVTFAVTMLAFFGVWRARFTAKMAPWQRILTALLAAAAACALCVLTRHAVFAIHESITHLRELLSGSAEGGAEGSAARSVSSANVASINHRFRIWEYSVQSLVQDTQRFFLGVTPVGVIPQLESISNGTIENLYTHNQLLEVGVALGVPAMCAFIYWYFMILRDSFRALILQKAKACLAAVPAFILMLMLANMMEATLLFYKYISATAFFLLCGYLSGKCEVPPADGKVQKSAKTAPQKRKR